MGSDNAGGFRHFTTRFFAVLAVLSLSVSTVGAQSLRWAGRGDATTLDPHSNNERVTTNLLSEVYEGLAGRGKQLELVPQLATEWSRPSPTVWRFKLRQGVTFHDGSPFTADDVIFSILRANAPTSNFRFYVQPIKEARKIDAQTIEIETNSPSPILLDLLASVAIVSKDWAEKNGAAVPQDLSSTQETFAVRNANGTGPFQVVRREPGVRTVMTAYDDYWNKEIEHNLKEIVYTPIQSDATRVAALLSGEVDVIQDLPVQDRERIASSSRHQLLETNEIRTIFLQFDVASKELMQSNVKGRNPFADVRVRRAVYQAIDVKALRSRVMRGAAVAAASIVPPGVNGYDAELDKRGLPFDPKESLRLLSDAGYPSGFEVGMQCSNDRYVNDEALCQAIVSMLARVGISVSLEAQTGTKLFQRMQNRELGFYLFGWGVPTFDGHFTLSNLFQTKDGKAGGVWNGSGYSNPKFDELIQSIEVDIDVDHRRKSIQDAVKLLQDDVAYVPLHNQVISWGIRRNVTTIIRPNNYFAPRWTKITDAQ